MNNLNNKTILVTGGTGSIGSEIVKQLLTTEVKKIVIFNRDEIKQFVTNQKLDNPKLEFIMGDIRNYDSIEKVFEKEKIDFVFHAAAMKHVVISENEPMECAHTNIIGTHNLIRLCLKYGVEKVVTISTDKAVNPTNVMGATKYIAERITLNGNKLSSKNQKFCCVRFGNVANSRGSVIPVMVERIKLGKNIWITDPNVTRFAMSISDAVKLVLKAAEITQGGEIFVLKMKAFRLGDLAEVMQTRIAPRLGKSIKVESRRLVTGEKLHEELLNQIELANLLENDKLYIILNDSYEREYPEFRKSFLKTYNSSYVEKFSLDELESAVIEYLEKFC